MKRDGGGVDTNIHISAYKWYIFQTYLYIQTQSIYAKDVYPPGCLNPHEPLCSKQ